MSRWYKRCGADFIRGTMRLTLEEKGAYSLCLDLMYDSGGPIPDDARYISGVCGCSMRKWSAIRKVLIEAGKLHVVGGCLSNARAEVEIVSANVHARNQAESGAKGGRKRAENDAALRENNDIAQASLKPIEETRLDKKEIVVCTTTDECQSVFDEWNAMAKANGLRCAIKLDLKRRGQLKSRLAEHGRGAFTDAIQRIARSPHCTGDNDRGWQAGFDFLLSPSSFLKVIEGAYDGKRAGDHGGGDLIADVLRRSREHATPTQRMAG